MKYLSILLLLFISCKNSKVETSKEMEIIYGSFNVVYISDVELNSIKNKGLNIKFLNSRVVSGFNGCNNFKANYTIEDSSISVGIIMATDRYCDNINGIDGKLMGKLRKANRFIINGNTLTLLDENNVLIKAEKEK